MMRITSILIISAKFFFLAIIAKNVLSDSIDICVNVLGTITSPVSEYSCGSLTKIPLDAVCIANPVCCTPGVCKVTPSCGGLKTVIKTIARKGDTHCFKGVSAESLWDRWKDGQIANLADVATGFAPEAVLPFVKADISIIASQAKHMPQHLQDLLKSTIRPVYDNGKTGYGYEDVRDIKIINQSDSWNTGLWLTEGKAAITLGSVVILGDHHYSQLMNPNNSKSFAELLIRDLSIEYASAFSVMVHELVHVKQYRTLGQDSFLTNYVLRAATHKYGYGKYEREAYNFTPDIIGLHGGSLCEKSIPFLDPFNADYDLGREPLECTPYVAWMIPFL